METSANDKAGKEYWNDVWTESDVTEVADPTVGGIKNVTIRLMHKALTECISGIRSSETELLEIGCANSIWLPYFGKKPGFSVFGLDYSEAGCEHERKILSAAGVSGTVFCADFFSPPSETLDRFDVVTSFGVVEHFVPTEGCLSAFRRFLKPGGRIITVIPNVEGLNGLLMKATNRDFFDKHVELGVNSLAEAHRKAGFEIVSCKYIFTTNLYVPNTTGLDPEATSTKIKAKILQNLGRISLLALFFGEKMGIEVTSKFFSPYVVCVGEKK